MQKPGECQLDLWMTLSPATFVNFSPGSSALDGSMPKMAGIRTATLTKIGFALRYFRHFSLHVPADRVDEIRSVPPCAERAVDSCGTILCQPSATDAVRKWKCGTASHESIEVVQLAFEPN